MNTIIATGRVHKYPATIRATAGNGKEYLFLTLADELTSASGAKFVEYVKVMSGDKNIHDIVDKLKEGAMAMVVGTAGIDNPKPKEGSKPFVCMKVYGKVTVMQEAARKSPIHDDDVPPRSARADNDGGGGDDNVPY
jgi:hypothetical protein